MDSNNVDLNFDAGIVPSGGKLPCTIPVTTRQLLDVLMALAPACRNMDARQKKKFRKQLNRKLYNKTRPGFYSEPAPFLHLAYVGQPQGPGTQHHWKIFCVEELKPQIETVLNGIALTISSSTNQNSGGYAEEWGGLYLRSEAELRIAQALDKEHILFFANARGRVGMQDTIVSDGQLTGRVETDFIVFYQGRCMSLEVDGRHHQGRDQSIRDYARDRVLLRFGVPTVRFTAQDCLMKPEAVVAEFLAILMNAAPDWMPGQALGDKE